MPRMLRLPLALVATIAGADVALAQPYPGNWNGRGGGWDHGDGRVATQAGAEPSRRIEVETFRTADAGASLGRGRIVIASAAPIGADPTAPPVATVPGYVPPLPDDQPPAPDVKIPVYEAAVIDRLGARGYDIANAADPAQTVEIAVSRDVVVPAEAPHRPVSGEASIGVSNRGMGYGLGISIDLTKPKRAITATRLDVRIRDTATHRVLWEGHALGQARVGTDGNDDTRMANRLATALFAKFPEGTVVAATADTGSLTPQ